MNTRSSISVGLALPFFMISLLWSALTAGAAENGLLKEPAKAVLENYEKIQRALAADSMTGVPESARTIAKAIRDDNGKRLPLSVAAEAEKLAGAQDLRTARRAFKPLSTSLIGWLADNRVESTGYLETYCPMADASWLQKDEQINNPYYGKRMLHCGAFDRRF
ncbi:MAG TPA: hypothetical protein VLT62_19855 [Candidatus Methylomirabilis sp.]|nr:hypothetical protein [Candidatus Methylomirabilis sp.]HSB81546.1 hypothetical protein [Candidatus Methylomirabilis sp.]